MEHAFNTNIAAEYDVNIAILIQHFKYWTFNNLANKRNLHQGLCWTYDTVEAFGETFHYWTRHQIEHLLKKAEAHELIVCGNHNQTKYDRTKWYALTPKAYKLYDELQRETFLKRLYSGITSESEIHKCFNLPISENSEMDFANFRNRFLKIPKPIPDTNPHTDPNINNISTSDEVPENDNQTFEETEAKEGLEGLDLAAKSDYQKNQTNKESLVIKKQHFDIKNILKTNIFQIPEEMIQDWISNRRKKRADVTSTAWSRINKVLSKLHENNIDPVEAFERMVASGWQSLEVGYFQQEIDAKKTKPSKSVNQSPLSIEEDGLFKEFKHLCKNRFNISDSLRSKIEALKKKLKGIDHPIAREALAEIGKLEEIQSCGDFRKLSQGARGSALQNAL